ncbi:MAG: IS4 family transposase [Bacteroidota bacterium]
MRAKVLEILSGMKSFLTESLTQREKYLTRCTAFTRNRILTFERLCLFLLVNAKRSLSIELDDFYLQEGILACSKSAFSKARYRVKRDLFRDWSKHMVSLIYDERHKQKLRTWKHFYLKGVDGTTLYLFDDKEVAAEFGGSSNQFGLVVLGRAGFQVDLLNGYCCAAWMGPHKVGEPHFAMSFLEQSSEKDLLIYDRNFISFELIYKHLQKGVPFLMRAALTFNKVVERFVSSGKKQAIEYFSVTDETLRSMKKQGLAVNKTTMLKVRLIRVELDSGEIEVLATNLLDRQKYPHKCFKELYNKRWGCETQIEKFKNKLQIEIFTGHKVEAIYQDFFATLILLNLHNLIVRSCEKQLEEKIETKENSVAINQNVSIGLLKKRLVSLFADHHANMIFQELKVLFLRHLEMVRPGRKYVRDPARKRQRGKYQTYKNYRRAF